MENKPSRANVYAKLLPRATRRKEGSESGGASDSTAFWMLTASRADAATNSTVPLGAKMGMENLPYRMRRGGGVSRAMEPT